MVDKNESLYKIKLRYRYIILHGRLKTMLVRCNRLDLYYLFILKYY